MFSSQAVHSKHIRGIVYNLLAFSHSGLLDFVVCTLKLAQITSAFIGVLGRAREFDVSACCKHANIALSTRESFSSNPAQVSMWYRQAHVREHEAFMRFGLGHRVGLQVVASTPLAINL